MDGECIGCGQVGNWCQCEEPMEPLDGPDYRDYEWEDETSQFDPEGRWQSGVDCYVRTNKCRVPISLGSNDEAIGDWIDQNQERVKYL